MADYIVLTQTPFVIPTSAVDIASAVYPDIRLAVDVSRWDIIDISIAVISPSTTQQLTIDFVTGMQMDADDYTWAIKTPYHLASPGNQVGQALVTATGANVSLLVTKSVPGSNALLRYLRWRAYYAQASTASLMMTAMGRRRGS